MNAAAEILAALKPLTAREERGRQIAKMGGIREVGAQFSVPSQTPGSPPYLVDLVEQTCTCDDYELRRKPCKHYEAVLSWIAAEGEADCPLLPELLKQTAQRFKVKEVSLDKAYLSVSNLDAIDKIGAVPFIPFKSNSVGMASKSALWRRMWCHFSLKSEDFLAHYHRRSNVESTMHMIKSKWGGSVRSKLPTAQMNEVLCKVLCHNLVCLVHAILEFDIDAEFWKTPAPTTPAREPHTPPTPRTSPALALVRS